MSYIVMILDQSKKIIESIVNQQSENLLGFYSEEINKKPLASLLAEVMETDHFSIAALKRKDGSIVIVYMELKGRVVFLKALKKVKVEEVKSELEQFLDPLTQHDNTRILARKVLTKINIHHSLFEGQL